jgi:Secretion system C-terminal sorting domain
MKKFILRAICAMPLLWADLTLSAQHNHNGFGCSVSHADQTQIVERMQENRRNAAALMADFAHTQRTGNGKVWIPIQFHIVGNSQGQGYKDLNDIWDNMCRLNTDYASQNIQFYMPEGPRYINNDALYINDNAQNLASYVMGINRVAGRVNVFIGEDIVEGGGTFGTTLGYYVAFPDIIYAIKSTVNGGSKTLTHEIGHYFTLAHPFFGWENQEYAQVIAVNGNKPPRLVNGREVELVPRRNSANANCMFAADGFCDTDPDYNFGLFAGGNCGFAGAVDPDSVPVPFASAADNFMSYFNDNCTNKFSAEQKAAIVLDVTARGYNRLPAPDTTPTAGLSTIQWPMANNPATNSVSNLRWSVVPNATYYIITIDRTFNGTFISRHAQFLAGAGQNNVWATLDANREYTWTVRATNSTDFCTNGVSAPATFRSFGYNVAVEQTANVLSDSRIFPNPTGADKQLNVEINMAQAADAQMSISNSLGQTVMSKRTLSLNQGTNYQTLDLSTLSAGLYIVHIETTNGRVAHRLVLGK